LSIDFPNSPGLPIGSSSLYDAKLLPPSSQLLASKQKEPATTAKAPSIDENRSSLMTNKQNSGSVGSNNPGVQSLTNMKVLDMSLSPPQSINYMEMGSRNFDQDHPPIFAQVNFTENAPQSIAIKSNINNSVVEPEKSTPTNSSANPILNK
jgi:hypothetical protein